MNQSCYTVITFAPVQGFIEKSRKLRDLYGSSYLLSYLSWVICNAVEKHGCQVISPALPNITQGMPNQIIIEGDFPEENAKLAFLTAWKCVTATCREWIEDNVKGKWVKENGEWIEHNASGELLKDNGKCEWIEHNANGELLKDNDKGEWEYTFWKRSWDLWTKYSWEFFWVQGTDKQSITDVREKLNEKKRPRDWTGINWQGESSTLSGADAIAYPKLGQNSDPRNYNYQDEKKNVRVFYEILSQKLGESFIKSVRLKVNDEKMSKLSQEYGQSFIDPEEELSIPELIKRLITHKAITEKLIERLKQVFGNNGVILKKLAEQINQLSDDLNPTTFTDLSRLNNNKRTGKPPREEKFWTGWFQGDGDKAGEYLKSFAHKLEEAQEIKKFSQEMREWGDYFQELPKSKNISDWRVIYAGGDDFLGVFYNRKDADDCVKFFSRFKADTWNEGKPKEKKKITVSVGFVWASPDIPQRDVLQHCRLAEKSAKSNGRDRIAFRILFNNGNHLEWVCPWWLLETGLLSSYRDRDKNENKPKQNWTHIYNDVAVLESRHAFDDDGLDVALGLLEIYFPKYVNVVKDKQLHPSDADLTNTDSGILGECKMYYKENSQKIDETKVNKALTSWIINLAKVGFHLCQQ